MPDTRPMLSGRAIQIVAENRIRAAIKAGEFVNLPGCGRKAAIFDEPYDPNWWIRRKLQREALVVAKFGCGSEISLRGRT